MRSSARCCQRLFCVFALCLAVVACDGALSEPPSAPSDAAESSADAQQTREAAEHMVFQEFTGSWDPVTQQLTFDALPYEDWDSVRGFSPDGVARPRSPRIRTARSARVTSCLSALTQTPCSMQATAARRPAWTRRRSPTHRSASSVRR